MEEKNPLPLPRVPTNDDLREAGIPVPQDDVPDAPDAEIDTNFSFEPASFDIPPLTDIPVHADTFTQTPTVNNVTDISGDLATLKMDIIDAIGDAVRLG